jgi:hypothetical protein
MSVEDIKRLAGLQETTRLTSNASIDDVINLLGELRAEAKNLMQQGVNTGGFAGNIIEHLYDAILTLEKIKATVNNG